MKIANHHILAAVILSVAASGTAFAKKPESSANGAKHMMDAKHGAHEAKKSKGVSKDSKSHEHEDFFNSERADKIRKHYAGKSKGKGPKKCPPGLAKKNNGCLPPGQAKNWSRGEALPSNVEYERVSDSLLREMGRTPEGQEVLRVGNDILLVESATRRVVEAIENLGSLF